jgi:hypothetical protein
MSLDIYLHNTRQLKCDCGRIHDLGTDLVFDANITHNLGKMADEAKIGDAVWNPEKVGIKNAGQLAEVLTPAIRDMDLRPDHYRQFSSSNGWGTYEDFIPWLEKLRDACVKYPNATIEVSR